MTTVTLPITSPPPVIAVVGNIYLDIKTAPISAEAEIRCDGETNVPRIYEAIGGAARVAVASARLGGAAHFVGTMGPDSISQRLANALWAVGVKGYQIAKPAMTGRSISLAWDNDQRHAITSMPSGRLLTARDVAIPTIASWRCKHLHRGDIWLSDAMLQGGDAAVLKDARDAGIVTSIAIDADPLWSASGGRESARPRIDSLIQTLPYVDYVHVNQTTLRLLSGLADIRTAAQSLIDRGAGIVIVNRDDNGSSALTRSGAWLDAPALPVAKAMNDTGAEDVFIAAFLLLADRPLDERLETSDRIAAMHAQGDLDLLPGLDVIEMAIPHP